MTSNQTAGDRAELDEADGADHLQARAKPLSRQLPLAPPAPDPPSDPDAAPALVPARMINEVLYCERLMYLEWVQGEWADNAFTVDGQAVHRRVNQEGQPLRAAPEEAKEAKAVDDEPLPYSARSVWLSSDRLGITAKIDLVEVDGGTVVPVEYKRSAEPDLPNGAYLPELAQVCAQVLLLRDHGYKCEHGEIYYAKSRKRVEIRIEDWLVDRTLQAVSVQTSS
jgi:CRISPR-associated protein Cas4